MDDATIHHSGDPHHRRRAAGARFLPPPLIFCRPVSDSQKLHLRSAGYKRDIVTSADDDATYVDRQSGTPFQVVGQVLPIASPSDLPWSEENLRLCGCSREQLVQKDVNDCPYCDRRIPAAGTE